MQRVQRFDAHIGSFLLFLHSNVRIDNGLHWVLYLLPNNIYIPNRRSLSLDWYFDHGCLSLYCGVASKCAANSSTVLLGQHSLFYWNVRKELAW